MEIWVSAGDAEMDRMINFFFFLQATVKCRLSPISQYNIDFKRYYPEETYSKNTIKVFIVKFKYVRLDIHTLIKHICTQDSLLC